MSAAPSSFTPPGLARRAVLLLLFSALLIGSAALYLAYARGLFESTQRLVLVAEDSEGVVIGMDLTFSGFPIGRVRGVELGADGRARILIDVPRQDAHWLRQSSVFTLVRGLVGNTSIRAYSGILSDPPLPDGAVREVLRGDATADIPRLVSSAREVLEALNRLAAPEGALGASLAQVQRMSERINGPGGGLGVLLGGDEQARRFRATLARTDALIARVDALAAQADAQVFGPQGLMLQAQGSVVQLRGLLTEARGSLGKLDAVLVEAQAVGANARVATQDLAPLRAEVEANLRKVESLLNEVNRKWPFARDPRETEIKLP
jgi:phospholipid/cholesterol/gamma-HCH transport system substrate-binding protein